jgi:3-oxoacyl-ACP reductase-like protein
MDASNVVAHELESYGVRTFSAKEMALEGCSFRFSQGANLSVVVV